MKLKIAVGIVLGIFSLVFVGTIMAGLILYELNRTQSRTSQALETVVPLQASASALVSPDTLLLAHSTKDNCWLKINNHFYDVTAYLNQHPGGVSVITPFCGKEATTAFNTKGEERKSHSQFASQLLSRYEVNANQLLVTLSPTNPSTNPNLTSSLSPTPSLKSISPTPISQTTTTLTTTTVSSHSTAADCWLIISQKVYNVTSYLNQHPGGVGVITPFCGQDAATAFNTKGGSGSHSSFASSLLNNYLVGALGSSTATNSNISNSNTTASTPTSAPTSVVANTNLSLTTSEVASHNSASNCWLIISNNVYNVTSYLNSHPGGRSAITAFCGADATSAFQTKGGRGSNHSNSAYNLLASYKVGALNSVISNSPTNTPPPNQNPTAAPTSSSNNSSLPASVSAKYPAATIIETNNEDDGRIEMKINYNGSCRNLKLNSSGVITSDKSC